MKIISFQATNFRGFLDTSHIVLRPVNLLIGKNSIGKSSFARLWPLFAQGTKLQKRAPILWNGDLVDFGSFRNVLSRHSALKEVGFEFLMEVEKRDMLPVSRITRLGNRIRHLSESFMRFRIGLISETSDGARTRCCGLRINGNGFEIKYTFSEDGKLAESLCNGILIKPSSSNIQQNSVGFLAPLTEYYSNSADGVIPSYSPLQSRLQMFLRSQLHQRLSSERLREICLKLNVIGTEDELLSYCEALPLEYKTWRDFLGLAREHAHLRRLFHGYVILAASENLIRDIDLSLKQYFSAVNYLRPLRAVAQRYYRKQELAVDSIDSEGANLAFFLESLPAAQLSKLNSWLNETLDVEVRLDGEEGHVMIKLRDLSTGRVDNIADMGFGFSQVLPLAVQAWLASSPHARGFGRVTSENSILVWEQPELHLHPAMQRKLARLVAATTRINKGLVFIIETHSQSIINEFGDMIVSDEFSEDDVQALLFSQIADAETTISVSKYDEDGQLSDWPLGFLAT
jgi:predicted ATPase